MEWLLSLFAGVGLAAATGFRVFVPLLGVSVAGNLGILPLASNFEWLSSPVAMGALAIATNYDPGSAPCFSLPMAMAICRPTWFLKSPIA